MNIEDIEIRIKKWDKTRSKNQVIVNLTILNIVEIRGYTARYTTTIHSPVHPVWIVTPPSIQGRNKIWFHIARFKDTLLWEKLQKRIIEHVKEEYTSSV